MKPLRSRYCRIRVRGADDLLWMSMGPAHWDAAATVVWDDRQLGFEAKLPPEMSLEAIEGNKAPGTAWMRSKCAALLLKMRSQRGARTIQA